MGDTDAGQPSGKTKYGRVPLWLYEAGVSLQAVGAYGWLHGKYGHFDRITPSYGTLAKEMGVSRGSVIAYVKELQAVGAVQIVQSGAQGRQTNEFAIAFDAPFKTDSTGQNTDQSAGRPVSGLYSGGQNADPGGQPAVQEEDVLLKTEDSLSSPASPDPQSPSAAPSSERETSADAEKIATAWAHAKGIRAPKTEKAIAADAAGLLAVGADVDHLCAVAAWMAGRGYADLERALTHKDAPKTTAKTRDSPPTSSLPRWCESEDCNPTTRYRTTDTADGPPVSAPCRDCHPDMIKGAA